MAEGMRALILDGHENKAKALKVLLTKQNI